MNNHSYEKWRLSYQSSEQAARSAYQEMMRLNEKVIQLETIIAGKSHESSEEQDPLGR